MFREETMTSQGRRLVTPCVIGLVGPAWSFRCRRITDKGPEGIIFILSSSHGDYYNDSYSSCSACNMCPMSLYLLLSCASSYYYI